MQILVRVGPNCSVSGVVSSWFRRRKNRYTYAGCALVIAARPLPKRKQLRFRADVDRRRVDRWGHEHGLAEIILVNHLERIARVDDRQKPIVGGHVEVIVGHDRRGTVLARATEALAIDDLAIGGVDGRNSPPLQTR